MRVNQAGLMDVRMPGTDGRLVDPPQPVTSRRQ
jgi:hypothetical protein